jgi:FtsZ-binding cell division protein ZapB
MSYNPITEEIINNRDDKIDELKCTIYDLQDEVKDLKEKNEALNDQNVRLAQKLTEMREGMRKLADTH